MNVNALSLAHAATRQYLAVSKDAKYPATLAGFLRRFHAMTDAAALEVISALVALAEKREARRIEQEELEKRINARLEAEKTVIRKVVRNALSLGYSISVWDSEAWAIKRSRKELEVMANVGATDMETLRFRDSQGQVIGSALMVWGNSPDEIFADWTDTEPMAVIMKPYIDMI